MTISSFDAAVAVILRHEGGYVNDPRDPGGETNFGICKRSYPNEDIKNMTPARAAQIYRRDYWDKCKCDQLPESIRLLVFDAAVNQGVGAAVKMLQKAVGTTEDGIIGPNTLAKVAAAKNLPVLYAAERAVRYANNANIGTYGRGWFRRLFGVVVEHGAGDARSETASFVLSAKPTDAARAQNNKPGGVS